MMISETQLRTSKENNFDTGLLMKFLKLFKITTCVQVVIGSAAEPDKGLSWEDPGGSQASRQAGCQG